jgi:tryptophan synthase alpha subunit
MSTNLQTQDRYANSFRQLKENGRPALIPFTLLGWPDPETPWTLLWPVAPPL